MKITLIEPAMIKKPTGLSEKSIFCFQPLALGVLAGMTPPEHEIEIIDDRFEPIDYDERRDLVGISVKTFTARRAYQIADEFRRRGTRVILGGHHATLLPEEAQAHADAVFIGEAERMWPTVLDDARHGRLAPVYQGGRETDYPALEINRVLFNKKHYLPAGVVETARGCPYHCSFCSVSTFFGGTFRRRNIGELVDEIRRLDKQTILFVDDNITGDIDSAKELFRALIPLKLRWMSQASIAMTRDAELMALMRASGCAGVLVGIESLFKDNLKDLRKGWNTHQQDYVDALRVMREHHIAVVGSFIIGLDHDTEESLDATLEFVIEQKFFAVLFNMLTPYPQTDLYAQFEREGRLRYKSWWLDPAYRYGQSVYQPANFSSQWIEQKRMRMYRQFFGPRSQLTRLLEPLANAQNLWHAMTYLMINLPGYYQESKRTGRALGLN